MSNKMKTIKRRTVYTGDSLSANRNYAMFSKKTKIGRVRRKELADKYRTERKAGVKFRRGWKIG